MIKIISGIICTLSFIYALSLLCRKRKRYSVEDKLVVITGASSGLGGGNKVFYLVHHDVDLIENT